MAQMEKQNQSTKGDRALQALSDPVRQSNIGIIGTPEDEGMEKGTESLFKQIVDENFPDLG